MAFNSLNAFYINKSSQTSKEEAKIFRIPAEVCGEVEYPLSNCKTNGLENMLDVFQYFLRIKKKFISLFYRRSYVYRHTLPMKGIKTNFV